MTEEIQYNKPKKPPMPLRRIIVYILGLTLLACIGLWSWKTQGELLVLAGTILGILGKMLTGDSDSSDVKEMNGQS